MKLGTILGASILLLVSVQAKASIYEYTYTGNPLIANVFNPPSHSEPLNPYTGTMTIDEDLVGSLANTSLAFCAGCGPAIGSHGLLAWDFPPGFADILVDDCCTIAEFVTDANRDIVEWGISRIFGGLDLEITHIQDYYSDCESACTWTAPPGTWSVAVVPIPAAIWLFGTALIGMFGFSKRRKSA